MAQPASRPRGFSLVELLVVIGIIGVLVGLLLPAIQRVRESVNRVSCANSMRQIGIAWHGYVDAYSLMPPTTPFQVTSPSPTTFHGPGWTYVLLSYLEEKNHPIIAEGLEVSSTEPVRIYRCPSRNGPMELRIDYAGGAASTNSAMYKTRLQDILDGTSNTMLLGEKGSTTKAKSQGIPLYTGAAPAPSGIFGKIWDANDLNGNLLCLPYQSGRVPVLSSAQADGAINVVTVPTQILGDPYTMGWGTPTHTYVLNESLDEWTYNYYQPPATGLGFGSAHSQSMNMLMCDLSVRKYVYGVPGLLTIIDSGDGAAVFSD